MFLISCRRLTVIVALLQIGCVPTTTTSSSSEYLWAQTGGECAMEPGADAVTRCVPVKVRPELLKSQALEFPVRLPDTTELTIVKKETSAAFGGGEIWRGTVSNDKQAVAYFSVVNSSIVGDVVLGTGRLIRLRKNQAGQVVLEELEPRSFPKGERPSRVQPAAVSPLDQLRRSIDTRIERKRGDSATGGAEGSCASLEAPETVDILVAYTQVARGNRNADDMIALANGGVEVANTSYRQSEVGIYLKVVGVAETRYSRDADSGESILSCMIDPTGASTEASTCRERGDEVCDDRGSSLQQLHRLRADVAADVVVMLVGKPGFGGIAKQMRAGRVDHSFAPCAFAVVGVQYVDSSTTLAHEVGHLMGAHHDLANHDAASDPGAFPFSNGHTESIPDLGDGGAPCTWMTVMGQQNALRCPRCLPTRYWSRPAKPPLELCGGIMGTAEFEDNARTLACTAGIVANFR